MKTFNIPFPIILFCALFIFSNCKKEDKEPTNPYIGCCGTAPVLDSVGDIKFYVPNAFSPNSDGINDPFTVYTSCETGDSVLIENFDIAGRNTAVLISRIVLASGDFQIWQPEPEWEGVGLFSYSFTIKSSSGIEKNVDGEVCLINCEKGEVDGILVNETIKWLDCGWATQHDGFGGYNFNIPSFENDCS